MRYDVVALVVSRRGISQLCELVAGLPPQFGLPIVCLAESDARLVADLASSTRLKVKWAEGGDVPKPGCIYVSPPGTSILMRENGSIGLAPFGAESTAMSPVDGFLGTLGRRYGNRTLGIVLGAFADDGGDGAQGIKRRGGTVLVLDRATAEYYGMADAIVKAGSYDRILTAREVADALRASFTGLDLLANAELQFELRRLLDAALRIAGTGMGDVQLGEPASRQLHLVAHRGVGKPYLDRFSVVPIDGAPPCARAYRLGQRIMLEDVFEDVDYRPYYPIARETGFSALQATPIPGNGSTGGVFSTMYPYPHRLSTHEAKSLDEVAEAARSLLVQMR